VIRRVGLFLAICGAALAQDSGQKKPDPGKQQPNSQATPPPKSSEPAPLFGGKLGTRSSQKTKESATLGFNGIDPSGKVDAQMLATSVGANDEAKVRNMANSAPTPAQLDSFIADGGLKKK